MNEDKSTRYRRLQRRASLGSAASAATVLLLVLVSGGSAAFRDALGGSRTATVSGGNISLTLNDWEYVILVRSDR